jgi:hypothetical protein
MGSKAVVLGASILVAVLVPRLARASDVDKARAYFEAGVDAYDQGKYEVALREFQHAHALSHNPVLYFNMAACEEHLNHYSAAALLLRQYVIEKPNADDRSKVESRIKVMEERDEDLHKPERHEPQTPVVTPPTSLTPAATAPPPAPRKRLFTWVALGATAAFGATALGLGAYTVTDHNSLKNSCGMTSAGCSSSQINGLHSVSYAADAFIGLTAAAAVATVVLFFVEGRTPSPQHAALTPTGVVF